MDGSVVMEKLPAELIRQLCLFLERPCLRAFRLACKAFALIGEEHLFHDFEFRLHPNHHRLYLLEQLAAKPSIASRLQCLSMQSGVQLEYADYRYWHSQVYHEKKSAWEQSLAAGGVSKDAYTQFHERLQARFTTELARIYDLYRWHLDQQAASMAERRIRNTLIQTLSALKNQAPFYVSN